VFSFSERNMSPRQNSATTTGCDEIARQPNVIKTRTLTQPNETEKRHTSQRPRDLPHPLAIPCNSGFCYAVLVALCFVMIWRNTVLKIYCLIITRFRLKVFVVSVKCKRSEIKWSEYVHGRKTPSFSISSLPAPCQLYFHVNLSQEKIIASFEQLREIEIWDFNGSESSYFDLLSCDTI
jgi:hypothetical protein